MIARRDMRVAIGALGVALAVIATPVAAADPAVPADPVPAPAPLVADPAPVTDAALASAPAAPMPSAPAVATPLDGVQHLPSPASLPPGTTQDAPEHPTTGLLRDIWYALRNGDMSGPDAVKLLATRPVNPEKLAGSKPSNQGPVAADAPALPAADAPPADDPAPPADGAPAPATDAVPVPAA